MTFPQSLPILTYARDVLHFNPPDSLPKTRQPRMDLPDLTLLLVNQLVNHLRQEGSLWSTVTCALYVVTCGSSSIHGLDYSTLHMYMYMHPFLYAHEFRHAHNRAVEHACRERYMYTHQMLPIEANNWWITWRIESIVGRQKKKKTEKAKIKREKVREEWTREG